MRIRYSILIIPLVVAACASSAGSPSAAAPSAAAPSVASEAPSVAPSEAPSVAPSESVAPVDPYAVYRDDTVKPVIDQITTAVSEFGEAFTTAAASGATPSDKVVFATKAFKVRSALASGAATLGEAVSDLPECGVEAQTQAQEFVSKLAEDSKDLVAETTTANSDQADTVAALVEQAAASATELTTALDQACAS